MIFTGERTPLRQLFIDAWQKQQAGKPLEPLERLIADTILAHPEYHLLLSTPEQALHQEFLPEAGQSNPFLHMAMHISLQEQLSTDRPPGISRLYQRLVQRLGDVHTAEHQLMECLAQMLWEAQASQRMPDEQAYLACVRKLVSG
jgi:hypothetical protein